MGLFGFGRKRRKGQETAPSEEEDLTAVKKDVEDEGSSERDGGEEADDGTRGERGVDHGPWDSDDEDVIDYDDYLDIGALMLPFLQKSELRLKANRETGQVLGATVTYGGSSLELEAFAAPRSLGMWDDVRRDLIKANPKAKEVDGVFGTELMLPVTLRGKELMTRIVGVDGPRWMLRGIFSGPAAQEGDEKDVLDRYFSDLVIVRGEEPLAPRDLIPMHTPVTPSQRAAARGDQEGEDQAKDQIPDRPEGPFDSDQQTEVKTTLSRGPMFSEVR